MKGFKIYLPIAFLLLCFLFSGVLLSKNRIVGNYGDIYLHYYPLKHLVAENIINGKMPLWNPYIFAGQPLLANPQSAIFYPITMIFFFLPLSIAFNYFLFLHFLLAWIFMYLLLCRTGFSGGARALSSFAFVFSSFLVYKVPAGHPVALSGYAWMPLVFLFLVEIKEEISRPLLFVFSIAISFQYLSGHIQPIYTSIILIVIHLIWNKFKYWKSLLTATFVSFSLCAIQFIPSLELSNHTEKMVWDKLSASYSLSFKQVFTLVNPEFYGSIIKGNFLFPDNPSFFFEKYCLYFGAIPLFLSLIGIYYAVKTKKYFMITLVLVSIVMSGGLNNIIYNHLYSIVPGLNLIRVPARFYFIGLFSLVVLAAMGWEALIKKQKNIFKLIIVSITIFDLLYFGRGMIFGQDLSEYLKGNRFSDILKPYFRIVTEPMAIAPNKSMIYHQYNLNGYETMILENFTKYIGLQEKHVFLPTGFARIDFSTPLVKAFSCAYELSVNRIGNKEVYAQKDGINLYKIENPLPMAFIPKTVKYDPDISVYEILEYLSNTKYSPSEEIWVDYLPNDFPRICENSSVINYSRTMDVISIKTNMETKGTLVVSEIFYPGWKAQIDNSKTRIHRANKVFPLVILNEGQHKIVLYFQPFSFQIGLLITISSLFFMFLLINKRNFDKIFLR